MHKRTDSQQENMQTVEIHLTGGAVIALGCMLLFAMVLGYLAWPEREAAASGAQQSVSLQLSTPAKYYLTNSVISADQALTACETGYHMASLWEIIDPSSLQYNGTLGSMPGDAGSGPPSSYYGWVRTGYASASSTTPGQGNCLAWNTNESIYSGTRVRLPVNWVVAGEQSAPWDADAQACNDTSTYVWCVED